ncbi:hypothetical protein HDV05_008024 [Chytridiales sp. JEL 0842]|nr:hypothetical protein HDV05_008024 [Chytridiales sp. JEL 0842]
MPRLCPTFRTSAGISYKTIRFFIAFTLWFTFTGLSNLFAKKYLVHGGNPLTLSWCSCGIAPIAWCLGRLFKWVIQLIRKKSGSNVDAGRCCKVDVGLFLRMVSALVPVASLHFANIHMTNMSIQHSDVKFTHTIKAAEPLFTVIFGWIWLRKRIKATLLLSLLPIPIGVLMATFTDASFTYIGLGTAVFSVAVTSLRSVLYKSESAQEKGSRGTSSFDEYAPSFYIDFYKTATEDPMTRSLILASSFSFLYNFVSFDILSLVSPLDHALGNVLKRVTTIMLSMIVFKNKLTGFNFTGMVLANVGILVYGLRAKRDVPRHVYSADSKDSALREQRLPTPTPTKSRRKKWLISAISLIVLTWTTWAQQSTTTFDKSDKFALIEAVDDHEFRKLFLTSSLVQLNPGALHHQCISSLRKLFCDMFEEGVRNATGAVDGLNSENLDPTTPKLLIVVNDYLPSSAEASQQGAKYEKLGVRLMFASSVSSQSEDIMGWTSKLGLTIFTKAIDTQNPETTTTKTQLSFIPDPFFAAGGIDVECKPTEKAQLDILMILSYDITKDTDDTETFQLLQRLKEKRLSIEHKTWNLVEHTIGALPTSSIINATAEMLCKTSLIISDVPSIPAIAAVLGKSVIGVRPSVSNSNGGPNLEHAFLQKAGCGSDGVIKMLEVGNIFEALGVVDMIGAM